ncbi:hypothetical protein QYE76_051635 [Lolium multiflorum]|uniref:Uncharacterized protein n=1 Tax=Lolium multiflorum TaxID=4521 RepID=A0AAD8WIT4_LOLMU|nr:hypothetical protein QYE76_051635 [Lolium multiflorum]
MPGSGGGGGDLAAWISPDVGSYLLLLLLRWSEGRGMKGVDASFNKEAAEHHLVQRRSSGRRLFLAGLGGKGGNTRASENDVIDELQAGRGGEEEHRHVVASSSASRRSYLRSIRSVVSSHRLCFSLACRGGEQGDVADVAPNAYRSQLLPKRCYGDVTSSQTLLLRRRSSG